jgi:hypothetical protein
MSLIDDIHKELDFYTYEADLRKVAGIWKSIASLQSELKKNPAKEKQYRAYITRCIKQLRDNDPELKGEAAITATADFNLWLDTRRHELGLPARELLRFPSGVEPWAERHLPKQFEAVVTARQQVCDRTSPRTLALLRQAYEDLFKAYLDALS